MASFVPVNKGLVSDELWDRAVASIVKEEGYDQQLAERVLDEALSFLRLCAADPSGHHVPSKLVDVGWHKLRDYSREYEGLCIRLAGCYIHHEPSDVPGVVYPMGGAARTVAAMKVRGIPVDEMLWAGSANCQGACQSCTAD